MYIFITFIYCWKQNKLLEVLGSRAHTFFLMCVTELSTRSVVTIHISSATYLEKAMAPHSSTLAWKIPWTEEPGRLQSMGPLTVDTTERLHFHFSLSFIGEGNGNPLQCPCLENPRDGGAWWAANYGELLFNG